MVTASSTHQPGVSLREVARLVRRRRVALTVGLVMGGMIALLWHELAPRSYTAHATVTINPITSQPFSNTPVNQLVNTATEVAILRSTGVAERAAARMGVADDPRDLLDRLTVAVPLSSLALDIAYTSDTPAGAARGANAFAASYLEFRGEQAEERRAGVVERLRAELQELRDRAESSDDGQRGPAADDERTEVGRQLSEAVAFNIVPGHLVSEALPPRQASQPTAATTAGGGVLLGSVFAALLAGYRHRRDDRLVSEDEIRSTVDLPIIGRLPSSDAADALSPREVDELAVMAMALCEQPPDAWMRSWLLVRPDDGTRTAAEALAAWLGRSREVRLVQLAGGAELAASMPPRSGTTAGPIEAARPCPASVNGETKPRPAHVVMDGGGLERLSEVVGYVERADAVILVVELGVTRRQELIRTVEGLRRVARCEVFVAVLARPDRRAPAPRREVGLPPRPTGTGSDVSARSAARRPRGGVPTTSPATRAQSDAVRMATGAFTSAGGDR